MPQMSPILWMVFPFVVMLLGIVVMVVGMEDGVEVKSELLEEFSLCELSW